MKQFLPDNPGLKSGKMAGNVHFQLPLLFLCSKLKGTGEKTNRANQVLSPELAYST